MQETSVIIDHRLLKPDRGTGVEEIVCAHTSPGEGDSVVLRGE
jgi:hypothetical protein